MRVDRDVVFAAVADERRQLAALLDQLDETQLATPSLCAEWDVKTVAAHLVSVFADGFWGFQRAALRCGSVHRGIDQLARRRAQAPASELARDLREGAEHWLSPPITGPVSGLTDVLTHGGDIRIPRGLPFAPDRQRVALALDFLTGPTPFGFAPRARLRGISLRAIDIDRAWGRGPEVHGPAAALMMMALGREALSADLGGPGLPILRRRLSR
jgi:uncharacterized protein (TIGR03083 family)